MSFFALAEKTCSGAIILAIARNAKRDLLIWTDDGCRIGLKNAQPSGDCVAIGQFKTGCWKEGSPFGARATLPQTCRTCVETTRFAVRMAGATINGFFVFVVATAMVNIVTLG